MAALDALTTVQRKTRKLKDDLNRVADNVFRAPSTKRVTKDAVNDLTRAEKLVTEAIALQKRG